MSTATAGRVSLLELDPAAYEPHALHTGDRSYVETNCYTDILIELIHARGDEPLAAMGFTVRTDFEGDQWTFFKPPANDLELLFGIDLHEMQPYRPLADQIADQIAHGRTLLVELDSFYLPDTVATSYRREHVKTSVIAQAIDCTNQQLGYFHNTGLHELADEDYRCALRVQGPSSDDVLPPYTELVRFDAGPRLQGEELRAGARGLLREHLARRPSSNPFDRFAEQLRADLPGLLNGDAGAYHAYAFATVRMVGSAFEVTASHVDWLLGVDGAPASAALREVVEGAKVLSFRLARRRAFDPQPLLDTMARRWRESMTMLDRAVS